MDKVVTRFLAMPVCNIATGQSLFDALEAELSSRSIAWENAVGFASDDASVMVGICNCSQSCAGETGQYIQPGMCMPPCCIVCSVWSKGSTFFCRQPSG